MTFLTETIEEKQKILIVSKKKYSFIDIFKKEFKKYDLEIFISPYLPKNLSHFNYCLCIDEENLRQLPIKTIYLFINKQNLAKKALGLTLKNAKIINVSGSFLNENHIDTILWFSFSETKESFLQLTAANLAKKEKINFILKIDIRSFFTKRNIIFACILFFIFIHTIFLLPLSFSLLSSYQAYKSFSNDQKHQIKNSLYIGSYFLSTAKSLYLMARPTFLLFSIALLPDTLIDINEKTNIVLNQSVNFLENIQEIKKQLFAKNKDKQETAYLILRLEKLKKEAHTIDENLNIIVKKLPYQFEPVKKIGQQLNEITEILEKINKLLPHIDNLLAQNTEKKYLLLFANNMEIRPGGGFLGSFGILKVKNYTIEDIEIHDVYDADGQLIAHIEPPAPIRKYLNIVHGFLRDSNFSPDFPENYETAKFFLQKELNLTGFSGSILITTTAIENILEAFGDIYLPNFNEYINKKNFYIKTQMHVEKDFFPGSIQKKSFLGSLTKNLIINVENTSPKILALALKKSLDQKQIIIYSEEKEIQDVLDSLYWSGRVIEPQCLSKTENNCIVDYLFPYDANVGVNKVNFFITRSMYQKTRIKNDGTIQNIFSVQFRNESPGEVFPGGTYKNYFQIMLPLLSEVKQITKDGILIEDYDEKNTQHKTIGLYFELPPKKTTEIKVEYLLKEYLKKGKGIYQLILQKQIGSSNNDYVFELIIPKNIHIINQNFAPLVKDNYIVYNTTLQADKIFFIELLKE